MQVTRNVTIQFIYLLLLKHDENIDNGRISIPSYLSQESSFQSVEFGGHLLCEIFQVGAFYHFKTLAKKDECI